MSSLCPFALILPRNTYGIPARTVFLKNGILNQVSAITPLSSSARAVEMESPLIWRVAMGSASFAHTADTVPSESSDILTGASYRSYARG